MKNTDILKKTMPFVWMRFFLYLLLGVGIIVYYVLVLFLIGSMAEGSVGGVIGIIALVVGIAIYAGVSRYFNYLVKAAHIAVISELAVTGTMPQGVSIVKYGQEQVKKRFVASSVFYGIDSLVSGAVSQIQKIISKVGGMFGNIQAVQNIVSIINLFVGVVLGYVDEAVLARIFSRKEENAWKGAADGVVLYFQNWKEILKNAVGLVIFIIVFYVVGVVILYFLFSGIFLALFKEQTILVFIVTILAAWCIIASLKASFVDSWITISVVNKYMQVSNNQQPQFDLYNKAKGWSKKFSSLCSKAEAEGAVVGGVVAAPIAGQVMQSDYNATPQGMPVQPQPSMQQSQIPQAQSIAQQTISQQPVMQQPTSYVGQENTNISGYQTGVNDTSNYSSNNTNNVQ